MKREPDPFVEINPEDALKLRIGDGDMVLISSRRGRSSCRPGLKEETPAGTVFIPFHWGDLFNEGNAANYLTISAIGSVAKQPELKFCAVNVEKIPASLVTNESGSSSDRLSLSVVGE